MRGVRNITSAFPASLAYCSWFTLSSGVGLCAVIRNCTAGLLELVYIELWSWFMSYIELWSWFMCCNQKMYSWPTGAVLH